ncbi:MAG: response regulator [Candidatus Omnitrophica bacterium]|nr:response regulator [Candidatus Omnitrophota bacterium]
MKKNGTRTLRVLIIEDDAVTSITLQKLLADVHTAPYHSESVFTLKQAFELLDESSFDIILLDLNLPDSKGIDTVDSVWRRAPNIPIVVTTGSHDERILYQTKAHGAQECLFKGKYDIYCLDKTVHLAIENKRLQNALRKLSRELNDLKNTQNILPQ